MGGQYLAAFDATVTAWVRALESPGMTTLMRGATALGSPMVLTLFCVISLTFFYRRGHRWEPIALLVSLVGGWAWDEVLKRAFHRLRPPGPWLAPAGGFSFPSGHSTVAVGFYGVLTYFLVTLVVSKPWRPLVASLGTLVILLVGISRIYLGVHYPSDVLGGFALGGVWGILCVLIGRSFGRTENKSVG